MGDEINLKDVLNVEFLQKFQDAFSGATGMASISVDLHDSVTNPSNFTEFCIDLTRGSKIGLERCLACDLKGGEDAKRTGCPSVYYCHAGLMDFGVPIVVNGQQIGSVIGGQVLPKAPDENKFRQIAMEIGVDPDKYINALRKIKIVPENQIREAANLLQLVISEITKGQVQYIKLKDSHTIIEKDINVINDRIREFSETAQGINQDQAILMTQLNSLKTLLKSINQIVGLVSKISQKTQIISINAAVESSRSGLEGRSFNVIAQEIRALAIETQNTVSKIETYTSEISKAVEQALEIGARSSKSLQDEISNINDIFPKLNDILSEMQKLNI